MIGFFHGFWTAALLITTSTCRQSPRDFNEPIRHMATGQQLVVTIMTVPPALTRCSRALIALTMPSTPALVDTSPCTLPVSVVYHTSVRVPMHSDLDISRLTHILPHFPLPNRHTPR